MRQKVTAKDRALGGVPTAGGGEGAGRQGIQEDREQRGRDSPIFSLFSSAAPPLLPTHLPRAGPNRAEEPTQAPAQPQGSPKVKGSHAQWFELGLKNWSELGGTSSGPLPHLFWLCDQVSHSHSGPQPPHHSEGITEALLYPPAVTIKWDNAWYALGTWAWQALRSQ